MTMKIKELLTTENGIFGGVFLPNYPEQFMTIFGDVSAAQMDLYVLLNWGEKTVVNFVTPENVNKVIDSVIALNLSQWVREAEAFNAKYDVLNPTAKTVEHTETADSTADSNGERLNAKKAYNDENFSDDERNTETGKNTRSESRNYTETEKGLGIGKNISENLQKEIQFRRDNWKKMIIFAVVKEITTDIY